MDALNVVQRLGTGRFIEDLAEHLDFVCEAVRAGKKGSKGKLTVTFDIEKPGDDIAVVVNETFGQTLPKKPARGALFFALDGLHASDPREQPLPVRAVERMEPVVRDADESPAAAVRSV